MPRPKVGWRNHDYFSQKKTACRLPVLLRPLVSVVACKHARHAQAERNMCIVGACKLFLGDMILSTRLLPIDLGHPVGVTSKCGDVGASRRCHHCLVLVYLLFLLQPERFVHRRTLIRYYGAHHHVKPDTVRSRLSHL